MSLRIAPLDMSYNTVGRLNKIATLLLYTSTLISICITTLGYFKLLPPFQIFLIVVNSLFICLYLFLDGRASYIFTRAEMKRRLDWLDNSFETNFSGKKSKNYFTNDNLSPGLYKLAVNCFENSYHTEFIISKMLPSIFVETTIIALAFVTSSYLGNKEIVRLFFELSLPAILIQKLIKAVIYSSRIAEVHDRFKLLFSDLMKHEFDCKTAEALRDILEYETALAWGSIPLQSKIFWKFKDELASDWIELKKEYKISL